MKILVVCLVGLILCSAVTYSAQSSFMVHFERAVGKSAKEQLTAAYGGEIQVSLHDHLRLQAIFERLCSALDSSEYQYSLIVLASGKVNAFSLPGGFIFVTRGMLKLIGDDDQRLAGVLAHEIAHVEKKHGINALMRQLGLSVIVELGKRVLEVPTNQAVQIASQALIEVVQSGYSREAEFEADLLAQYYLVQAGFDPTGIIHVLSDLAVYDREHPSGEVFRSHPHIHARIGHLLSTAGSFWSEPQLVEAQELQFSSKATDPLGRFLVEACASESNPARLTLYDQQNGQQVTWFDPLFVTELAFAPDGALMATAVWNQVSWDVWLWNRYGTVVERWHLESADQIRNLTFAPDGKKIAYTRGSGDQVELWVGYVGEVSRIKVAEIPLVESLVWQVGGITAAAATGECYRIAPPAVVPVKTSDPIPVVIERKPRLSPEIDQGLKDSVRLTRPSSIEL